MRRWIGLALCGLAYMGAAQGADLLLRLTPDVAGDSTIEGYTAWLEGATVGFQVQRAAGGEPQLAVSLSRFLDRGSPLLMQQTARGSVLDKLELHLVQSELRLVWKLELEDVLLTSYTISGSDRDRPLETLELVALKVRSTYYYTVGGAEVTVVGSYPPDGGGGGGGGDPNDSDGDGMPNTFETEHGLDLALNDRDSDRDGDGQSNWIEFRLDTSPSDFTSFFQVTGTYDNTEFPGTLLQWRAVVGEVYRIEFTYDLNEPFRDYDFLTAETTEIRYFIPDELPIGFYKVTLVEDVR